MNRTLVHRNRSKNFEILNLHFTLYSTYAGLKHSACETLAPPVFSGKVINNHYEISTQPKLVLLELDDSEDLPLYNNFIDT